ncbi:leucine-rich repeat protein [uncultured Eubacterium sp.]|uniref:leucine-rich repeat protein n=1 Tax=uncultured Eubacterium sp. TaxID=165185 RepID=UPI000ED0DE90|nr:leucine-rich repeat protein [uncultured Eubacterium sp.]HAH17545.1 hypothetical protein [Eubacterium sp.]
MMRVKKKLLAVIAALSLVGTSFNTMNTTIVYAEKADTISLEEVDIYSVADGRYKYDGNPVELVLTYSENGEDYFDMEENVDYKVIGYAENDGGEEPYYDGEDYNSQDWTSGSPKEPGDYWVLIKGMGNLSDLKAMEITIVDPYDMSTMLNGYTNEMISYIDIFFDNYFYDNKIEDEVNVQLEENVDYVFDGWCKEEQYYIKPIWSKEKITEEGMYAFKFTGKGDYKGSIVVFYEIPDVYSVSSYKYDVKVKYNAEKKQYENYLYNKYITQDKDFVVKYCNPKDFNSYLSLDENSWIDGVPNKNGTYVVRIDGIGSYKGVFVMMNLNIANELFILDGNSVAINKVSHDNSVYVAICPSETKEYIINSSNSGSNDPYAVLYDENYNRIDDGDDIDYDAGKMDFVIKVTLEAGKYYYLQVGTYKCQDDGTVSYTISIDGSYKYYNLIVNDKKEEKKPEQKSAQPAKQDEFKAPAVGTKLTDKNFTYKVTKAVVKKGEVGEVEVTGLNKKSLKKIKIADKVTIDGITYNVTSIGKNAFKGNKKATQVTIGKNVTKIGAGAFADAKKLKKVIIKSTKITKIGKKAFARKKGKKLTFKVNKKNKKAYKKLLKKAKTNKFVVK